MSVPLCWRFSDWSARHFRRRRSISFLGTIRVGVYAVVTPIAMILALVAVTWKRRRTLEELQAEEIAKQYFYDPGQTLSSGRNGGQ